MAFKRLRTNRYSTYQICITILEGRHLPQNVNPMVVVKVGNQKRKTVVRERTDSPVYNEYFVFDFTCNLDTLLSTRIIIAVYLRSFLRQFKFYGSTVFEVATVWDQPDHQYYHKWALLNDPKDPSGGVKGYVKCNITVSAKGEKVKAHAETEGEDDIEGNLLLPIGGNVMPFRQYARYIFIVYRADGLPDMSTFCVKNEFENINSYVQISFAGMKGTTSEVCQTYSPRFNESIVFKEMFPPLCHRIRIAIKHRVDSCRSCTVATYILNMSKISNSGEYGFLPTFGPAFVHFYGSPSIEKIGCTGRSFVGLPLYRGRLLLSLKTEMDDPEASSKVSVQREPVAPIVEKTLWKTEDYLLVAILYDVCMIDRRRFMTKTISFEISLGNAGNKQYSCSQCNENDNNDLETVEQRLDTESQTVPRTTGSLDGKYNYLPLGSRKPCIYVKSRWPNLEWRMFNSNNLNFIAIFIETELEKLEALVVVENPEAYKMYNDTVRKLKIHCMNYLHTLDTGRYDDEGGTTKLDRYRVNLCRKEVEGILKNIKINGELPNNNYIKIAMVHAYQYLKKFKDLQEDPQHSLPNVFIWMIAGSKRVAYSKLPARQLIYSEETRETGRSCGQRINVFLRSPGDDGEASDYVACKIELFCWLGNIKFSTACWSAIPPGYEVNHQADLEYFPKYFEYSQSSMFQLRAHIFQGRFDPGMDASGLLDPIVRVAFRGYTATTRVIKQSLDPFWDETLMFPAVRMHGTREHIKLLPPEVVLQVFDQDLCGTKEFCGRCIAIPVVKLVTETYSPPEFPPKLQWYKFKSQRDCSGSVLAAFELIETGDEEGVLEPVKLDGKQVYSIPPDVRPKMTSHRLEVVFWGVRDMRKINYIPVRKPRIVVECAGVHVKSEVMENVKKSCNFEEPHVIVDLDMPELDIYYPSITIKAYDSRGFGCFKYAGICIVPTVYIFLEQLITEEDYQTQIKQIKSVGSKKQMSSVLPLPADYNPAKEESRGLIPYEKMPKVTDNSTSKKFIELLKQYLKFFQIKSCNKSKKIVTCNDDDETLDWWSKYFASLERERNEELGTPAASHLQRGATATFKIYQSELESQPEFHGFQDRLRTFELWRGKRSEDPDYDGENFAGKFKGQIAVYRWPHPQGFPCKTRSGSNAAYGLCSDFSAQEPVKILVRIYIIKGINLQPNDPLTGKSDPYLCIKLGRNNINDRKNYIPNQLNPTFGRRFELEVTFPQDYLLTIQLWDHDATTADDFIGETRIDIENRFYSRHRAFCGISRTYSTTGYNTWRDREKPTQILELLCKKNNLPPPEYIQNCVNIGKKKFPFVSVDELQEETEKEENMALNVLHQWQSFPICGCALVPEHVERRPLFNSKRPGLEQGKLELWIDMFQLNQLPPKPPADITAKPPEEYEIRAIVWNTEDVPLVESQFLTGEKCSDIYVKGWILYEDHQRTDVHYNSLTGEGNFNWRFVFRVTYSRGEHVMIVRKRTSLLARSETEQKLPCRLHLQVWDSDHFSPDDFLGNKNVTPAVDRESSGALTLDLARMPRGSGNSKNCGIKILDSRLPTVNLFKATRIKAWWPFLRGRGGGTYIEAGKVELELSVVPAAEADEQPVGRGRDPPQALPSPSRPDTSFSWFRNPWKACCFVVCRYYKWRIICCLLCILLVLLIACGIYAFPGYLVKRILQA